MKYRIKVTCPTCSREGRSAAWDSRAAGVVTLYTHRSQVELADGEKPVRCPGSGDQLPVTAAAAQAQLPVVVSA